MKLTLFLSLLFTSFTCAFAQNQRIITLKNGTTYLGAVISNANGKVKLMGNDFNTYNFDTSEIKSMVISNRIMPSKVPVSGFISDFSAQLSNKYYHNKFSDRHDFYPVGIKLNYAFEKVIKKHAIGAEFILFINNDIVPTLGLKYRYEIFAKPNTPFIQIGAGNYSTLSNNSGLGRRLNAGIGYQWGMSGFKRNYLIFDITHAKQVYNSSSYNSQKNSYKRVFYSLGFGFRF